MILAGIPAATVYGGISLVTTELAPIMAPSPIVTFARIVTLSPIHTFLPIMTGPLLINLRFNGAVDRVNSTSKCKFRELFHKSIDWVK